MITQIANAVTLPQGASGQPSQSVENRPRPPASAVELPQQAVRALEKIDTETVRQSADQINRFVSQFDRNLQFTVDEETGTNVVKVIDMETEEVIRQIPSEELLAIARALDKLQGLLIKDKA